MKANNGPPRELKGVKRKGAPPPDPSTPKAKVASSSKAVLPSKTASPPKKKAKYIPHAEVSDSSASETTDSSASDTSEDEEMDEVSSVLEEGQNDEQVEASQTVEDDPSQTPKPPKLTAKAKPPPAESQDSDVEMETGDEEDSEDSPEDSEDFDDVFAEKVSIEDEEGEDDDDEVVFITGGRKGKGKPYIPTPMTMGTGWLGDEPAHRKEWPNTFYDSHEEPIGNMPIEAFTTIVKELGKKKVVFVATCGKWRNRNKQKLEERAINYVLGLHGLEDELQYRELGSNSAWALYGCETEDAVKKLVETEVYLDLPSTSSQTDCSSRRCTTRSTSRW